MLEIVLRKEKSHRSEPSLSLAVAGTGAPAFQTGPAGMDRRHRDQPAAVPAQLVFQLRHLEAEFMNAAADHGSAGYLSYYADDAVEVPNGEPIITGKVTLQRLWDFSTTRTTTSPGVQWAPTSHQRGSGLYLRYLRVQSNRERREVRYRTWQIHEHLEEAKGRRLGGCSRYGPRARTGHIRDS